MKKSFRYYYLKFLAFVLLTIGMLVGFTTKIIAQYGAPVVNFFMKGKVYSKTTQQPISDISIQQTMGSSTSTNQNGEFSMPAYIDWGAKLEFMVEDVDGDENGAYKSKVISLNEQIKRSDTLNLNFYLEDEALIQDIVKENNFPTKLNEKEIVYKDILYIQYPLNKQATSIEIHPLSQYKYDVGTLYFNNNIITKSQLLSTNLTFYLYDLKPVNYFLIDISSFIKEEALQKIILLSSNNKAIELKQTPEKLEAVIIYAIKPEERQ